MPKEMQPSESTFIFWFILFRNTSAEFPWEDRLPMACVLDDDIDIKDEVHLIELWSFQIYSKEIHCDCIKTTVHFNFV